MHRLLLRQLRKHLNIEDEIPEELRDFVDAVDQAYKQADDERLLLERSLELTSNELLERYNELREDLSNRRLIEEALRTSEMRQRTILATLPDILFVLDDKGIFLEVHASDPAHPLVGAPQETLIGSALEDRLATEHVQPMKRAITKALQTGVLQQHRLELSTSAGPCHFEARIRKLRDDVVLIIVRDTTELTQMQERLMLSERMASMGTLAAGVAHEINNPLTFVTGNLELLKHTLESLRSGTLNSYKALTLLRDMKESIDDALVGTERVTDIVKSLKTFSRVEPDKINPIDIHEVLETCTKMATNEVRHRAQLICVWEPELPKVLAHESQIAQVFLNLLVNAAHALPLGEANNNTITIRTSIAPSRNFVHVDITDTGPGIPPEVMPHIFEPFFTTKPAGEGTGLGLAICRNIVTTLGGRIEVRTGADGTQMRVVFPVWVGEDRIDPTSNASHIIYTSPARVLIIDDEVFVARVLNRMLPDFDVRSVTGGEQGLRLLLNNDHKPFDVILCDVMMPSVSGIDIYNRLRDEKPEALKNLIFMTGGAFTHEARSFLSNVPNLRLQKPIHLETLRNVIDKLMALQAQEQQQSNDDEGRRLVEDLKP